MTHPLTLRLDKEDIARLDEIAAATDRKRSWHMTRAIQAYIEDEYAFLDGVRRGLEAVDDGEVVPHDTIKKGLKALLDGEASG
jgi:predicted transcriptional regulator